MLFPKVIKNSLKNVSQGVTVSGTPNLARPDKPSPSAKEFLTLKYNNVKKTQDYSVCSI